MSHAKHISFEEFAADAVSILESVRSEHLSVVVEYASGEKIHIKPYALRSRTRKPHDQDATARTVGKSQRPLAEHTVNTQNISSVGAVYDLDPGSITPG